MSTSGASGRPAPAHKVLNNNVVITIDETGRERVLMGRGLGFGLKPEDAIDPAKVEKTFTLDSGDGGENELRLLSEVPYPVRPRPGARSSSTSTAPSCRTATTSRPPQWTPSAPPVPGDTSCF